MKEGRYQKNDLIDIKRNKILRSRNPFIAGHGNLKGLQSLVENVYVPADSCTERNKYA